MLRTTVALLVGLLAAAPSGLLADVRTARNHPGPECVVIVNEPRYQKVLGEWFDQGFNHLKSGETLAKLRSLKLPNLTVRDWVHIDGTPAKPETWAYIFPPPGAGAPMAPSAAIPEGKRYGVTIDPREIGVTPDGDLTGTVVNDRREAAGSVILTFNLFNDNNEQFGTATASIENLEGRATWRFRALNLYRVRIASFRLHSVSVQRAETKGP